MAKCLPRSILVNYIKPVVQNKLIKSPKKVCYRNFNQTVKVTNQLNLLLKKLDSLLRKDALGLFSN